MSLISKLNKEKFSCQRTINAPNKLKKAARIFLRYIFSFKNKNENEIVQTGDKKNKSITRTNSPSITANTNAILVIP